MLDIRQNILNCVWGLSFEIYLFFVF